MKINKLNYNTTGFRSRENEYNDPLLKWPLRGTAFTNEVGEAMRPLIGEYATLSWAPALLYIGADVYDKYKNDQTEYSPSSRRALKQAIFQGLASVCLPVLAVKGGQNIFSLFGLLTKDKITYNTKEHVLNLVQDFVSNGKMHAFDGKDEECVSEFLNIVSNNLNMNDRKYLKQAYEKNKANVHNFSESTIRELIKMRNNLLNPTEEFKNDKLYQIFKDSIKSGQTENVAIKSTLNKHLKKQPLKGNFVKTIGGFIALGLAIKPIDTFVEEVLIGKVVAPQLDKKA